MPKRIQRKRTKGWRMPEGAVNVCRPTIWGNPFVGPFAVTAFRRWLRLKRTPAQDVANQICERQDYHAVDCPYWPGAMNFLGERVMNRIEELRGKDLACFCALDQPCHADVLLELANWNRTPKN